jgi:hypothetical protein
MPYILAPTNPLLWAVQLAGATIETGVTRVGELTITGDDKLFVYSDDENDFLYLMLGEATGYQPLPDSGWLEAGIMYSWEGNIVIVRQPHNRTEWPPTATHNLFLFYQEGMGVLDWIVGEQVYLGTRRMYNDVEYVCKQAHVTQADYTPDVTAALWDVALAPETPWQSGTIYNIDDVVTHVGRTWKSLMNANGYEPGAIGSWRDQTVPPMWVAPAGSIGLWHTGDQATHNGQVWQCTINNNTYEPGVYGWTLV